MLSESRFTEGVARPRAPAGGQQFSGSADITLDDPSGGLLAASTTQSTPSSAATRRARGLIAGPHLARKRVRPFRRLVTIVTRQRVSRFYLDRVLARQCHHFQPGLLHPAREDIAKQCTDRRVPPSGESLGNATDCRASSASTSWIALSLSTVKSNSPARDQLAILFEPLDQPARFHRPAKPGHDYVVCHVVLRTEQRAGSNQQRAKRRIVSRPAALRSTACLTQRPDALIALDDLVACSGRRRPPAAGCRAWACGAPFSRRTGASRSSKARSITWAAISAPMPHGAKCLVDDSSGRSLDRFEDRVDVERRERARVDHLDRDALVAERVGGFERFAGPSAPARRR